MIAEILARISEIYWSGSYYWSMTGQGGVDVETVSLHEAGHGLSQAHFGKIFASGGNGKLHFSPLAVMNERQLHADRARNLRGPSLARPPARSG